MEISIGKTIKKLRAEKGVTQEELAKYLNITYQSVSKWETEAASPDTMLLPKIAVFFGVAIDDLFSVGDINHFERIDKILEQSGEELSESNFLYVKRYLVGLLSENPTNTEALRRLIDLHKKRIDSYTEIAARYAEQAISTATDNHDLHFNYARLRGVQWDYEPISWRFFRFYDGFIKKYPDNKEAIVNLHSAYVQTYRYEEAEEISDRIKDDVTREVIKGDTLIRLGRIHNALDTFDKILKANPDNPNLRFEIGERYRQLAERRINPEKHEAYFKYAIELFEQSQKLFDKTFSPPPCQSVYSRAFLYDNLGYYEKAIEMWEEIIMRNKRDYNNEVEGESNKWPRDMIEALKNKITQRGK